MKIEERDNIQSFCSGYSSKFAKNIISTVKGITTEEIFKRPLVFERSCVLKILDK